MKCLQCDLGCRKFGKHRNGLQRFRCPKCGKTYTEDHTRLFGTMTVPEDQALLAIQLLIEGTSIRSTERITGLHRDTTLRLLVLAGERLAGQSPATTRTQAGGFVVACEVWSALTESHGGQR